jgi:hypothetical protein
LNLEAKAPIEAPKENGCWGLSRNAKGYLSPKYGDFPGFVEPVRNSQE